MPFFSISPIKAEKTCKICKFKRCSVENSEQIHGKLSKETKENTNNERNQTVADQLPKWSTSQY